MYRGINIKRINNKKFKIKYTMVSCLGLSEDLGLVCNTWIQPISYWSLLINLMVQPQANNELWMKHRKHLAYKTIESSSIDVAIKGKCGEIAFGYVANCEKEFALVIPDVIKNVIGLYLVVEACEFDEFHINDQMAEKKVIKYKPPDDSLFRMKVYWKTDQN